MSHRPTSLGLLIALLAAATFGMSGAFVKPLLESGWSPVAIAATSMTAGLVVLLPFALVSLPAQTPGWKSVASAVMLGVMATAVAQVLSYRMIRLYGSSRAVLVAYMLPAFALLYGAVFLSEALTWQKLFGLVMILGGVGLGSGAVKLPRRMPVTQSP